ncbi:unnamed protein product [Durusdinium trenchii]|uniref:Uncharacterized protein n=1 Tax=Durusdinium trenchii TaxID=1381693 RepID=A0ABP0NS96_9DINO
MVGSVLAAAEQEKDHIICVCAIGYPSWYMPTTIKWTVNMFSATRNPLSKLFFRDSRFETPLSTEAPPFSRYGRCYEACQWAPSSFNAQPVRVVGHAEGQRFDFYGANSSRYYTPVAVGIWLANWETGCEALKIKGHFKIMDSEKLDVPALTNDGPVYDMSWICSP